MKHAINLIPASILDRRARRSRLRLWIAVDAAALAIAAAAWLSARPQADGLITRLQSEHLDAGARLAVEQANLARTRAALNDALQREATARRIGARPDFSGLLLVVGERLDPRATLEQVLIAPANAQAPDSDPSGRPSARATGQPGASQIPSYASEDTQYQLLINGVAVSAGVVNRLVLQLDETGYFSHVTLNSTGPRPVGDIHAVQFRITGTLGVGRVAAAPEDKP
ncbi:MAG: hypothetical protein R3B68_10940 [Phycisphaerales bacterium]